MARAAEPKDGTGAARPRRRALSSRVSTGHVVMILAGVLGALLTLGLVRSADHTRPVLVAATDLAPGAVLDRGSIRVVRVHADGAVSRSLVPGDDPESVRGKIVTRPLTAGSLVTRDALQTAQAGTADRVMSFPLARARAVGGKLVSGDRVDVLAVNHDSGHADYVVTGAPVVGVEHRSSGPLDTDGDLTISVTVSPGDAAALASALEASTVTLVRSTGAEPFHEAPASPTAPAASRAAKRATGAHT